jgi:DNA (cytosine-5)-methyltransferase 1
VEPVSRLYRLHPDGLANTLRAGAGTERGAFTSPRPIHPKHPRVVTVREAARLHSFPDWFGFHATKWHGFRQIGNAVPPLLGRAVGSALMHALNCHPVSPARRIELGDRRLLDLSMRLAAERLGADPTELPAPRSSIATR